MVASCARRSLKKGSGRTNSASGRSSASVAKAALISRPVPVLKIWICSPIARPVDSASLTRDSARAGLAGLTKTATRLIAGHQLAQEFQPLRYHLAEEKVD